MFICEISIIILIVRKLGSVGRPVQQKIKLRSPKYILNNHQSNISLLLGNVTAAYKFIAAGLKV